MDSYSDTAPLDGVEIGVPASSEGNPLRRTLTTWDLTGIGVGGIIGAGVFVLTGQAAALYAGPAVILSFLVSGIACLFSALCYAELSSTMPVAGSAYSFATATLGQFIGWLNGWSLILEYAFGASTVAVGWSGYAVSLIKDCGGALPTAISQAPFAYNSESDTWTTTGGYINLPAVFVVLAMTAVNVIGIRESAQANNVVVAIKASVLIIFVIAGSLYVNSENWSPFVPESKSLGQFGFFGILRGSAVVFFSYIGFDSISTAAQEAKNPQFSLPIATIASLLICTSLYIAVGTVLTGMVSYTQLNVADPIAVAVDAAGPDLFWLRPVVKVGAILGLTSVIMVLLMGQARIFYAMAEDGMLPPVFAIVHPRFKTPIVTTIVAGLGASVIAGLLPIGVLGEMVSIGTLFAFILVCAGVIALRRNKPHMHRPFRVPFVPWTPLAGILTAAAQMVALPYGTWIRLAVWLAIGVVIYWFYSRHHVKRSGERAILMGMGVEDSPSLSSPTSTVDLETTSTPSTVDTPSDAAPTLKKAKSGTKKKGEKGGSKRGRSKSRGAMTEGGDGSAAAGAAAVMVVSARGQHAMSDGSSLPLALQPLS